jgi:hypothetical protein
MTLASIALAALLGYCGVRLWIPADDSGTRWTPVFHAALGLGLGSGFTACLYWLLVVSGADGLPVLAGVEIVMLAVLGWVVQRRRGGAGVPPGAATGSPTFPSWLPATGLIVMLGLFAAAFVHVTELNPQGGWDAFSIWNLRARFLLHSATWKFAVTPHPVGTHMEYPLLLSSLVARAWKYAGVPSGLEPAAIALLFSAALVVLLVSSLALVRGTSLALLAGVVLLANPSFLNQAPLQYADIPLAYFFLGAMALIACGGGSPRRARWLSLAGVFGGFAAWTKNEGVLMVVALAAALLVSAWRAAGWRSAIREAGLFLLGALPGLLLAVWFKVVFAPSDPMAGQISAGLGPKLFNGGRWLQIAGGFLRQAFELYLVPLVLLAAACGLLRLRPRQERTLAPVAAVLVVLAGYFAIFLVTTYDLEWLFASALDRLYLHVWPAMVLAAFLLLRRPEDFAIVSGPVKAKKAR